MSYIRPDVYVERIGGGAEPIQSTGTATAGFIGITSRGKIGEPTLITSWTDFVNKFAKGEATPFMRDSDLAYSIYGYFQNGGGRAYVVRVAGAKAKKATVTIPEEGGVTFIAKDEGSWANDIEIEVKAGEEDNTFDVILTRGGEEIEVITGLSNNLDGVTTFVDTLDAESDFITAELGTLTEGKGTLIGGEDDLESITDEDYLGEKGLKSLDPIDDVTLIVIPGQTSNNVQQGILDYCQDRGDCFGIIDLPMGITPEMALEKRKTLSGPYGACYYLWGKVVDPLNRNNLRRVPPSGHIAGVYARTDRERGVHKAPAGLEAKIRGFVEVETTLTNDELGILNSNNINCIVAKPNIGIVVWGARLLNKDKDRFYVSDMRLDIDVEKSLYEGTQWTLFEPNNEALWKKLSDNIKAFLYEKWLMGAFIGNSPDEAYFVKCDEELNNEKVREEGKVIAEIGYAKTKPAEFTILRITQKTSK